MFILNQFFQANVHLSCNITIDVPVLQFHVVFPTQCNVFLVRYLKNPSLFHHTEAMSKLKKKKGYSQVYNRNLPLREERTTCQHWAICFLEIRLTLGSLAILLWVYSESVGVIIWFSLRCTQHPFTLLLFLWDGQQQLVGFRRVWLPPGWQLRCLQVWKAW